MMTKQLFLQEVRVRRLDIATIAGSYGLTVEQATRALFGDTRGLPASVVRDLQDAFGIAPVGRPLQN